MKRKHVERFGENTPMGGRPGQPREKDMCYVFLVSEDSSYMTGQVIHLSDEYFNDLITGIASVFGSRLPIPYPQAAAFCRGSSRPPA